MRRKNTTGKAAGRLRAILSLALSFLGLIALSGGAWAKNQKQSANVCALKIQSP